MRALSLFSGGLDSILAVKLIEEQGIDVIGIFFESSFFTAEKAAHSAYSIELPLQVIDITDRFLPIVLSPRHGYGKGLNPCIDCHKLMFEIAGEMLKEMGADFIISGEVVGQRPMSQNLKSLSLISHDSGLKDLILRPLSAKRLPETLPEKECWVMREKLLGLSGRSRKPQIELANKFGIKEYPAPAGGCLLTDVIFSRRLRDLIVHDPNFSKRDIELLKVGRHFRINKGGKIIVGRDQRENEMITALVVKGDTVFSVDSFPGPTVLVTGVLSNEEIQLAASITVSYSDAGIDQAVSVKVKRNSKRWTVLERGKEKSNFHQLMI
jgi:tRNA U34 2-thiouridine synthase MnmA/TrmU